MDNLWKLKDTLVDYLSPSAAKRRRTINLQTPRKDGDSEPTFAPMPDSEPVGRKKAMMARTMEYDTPQMTKKRKRAMASQKSVEIKTEVDVRRSIEVNQDFDIESEEYKDEIISDRGAERSFMYGEGAVPIGPYDSVSQSSPVPSSSGAGYINPEGAEGHPEEEEDEAEEYDNVQIAAEADAKVQDYLSRQAELGLRKEEVDKARATGEWHDDEVFLFERLAMRSFEPLIPVSWRIDFPTLPEDVFEHDVETPSLAGPHQAPEHHARKALQTLLQLGVRVRHNADCESHTERLMSREIKHYISWAEKDGGLSRMRYLPNLVVVTAEPYEAIDSITKSITDQMNFLGRQHREHLALPRPRINELGEQELYERQPPLLYGMIIVQTLVLFVTLDSNKPGTPVKHFNHFQFKDKDMDVWNGFAIAMMVLCARDYLMENKIYMEEETEPLSDRDA